MGKLNVKAGDKVIVATNYGKRVSTVEKITPGGFIKVDGELYYNTGLKRGDNVWRTSSIHEWTEAEEKEIIKTSFISKTLHKVRNLKKITYEQAVAINDILEKDGKNNETN